ncbi:MAG: hypothetical protein ACYC35_08590 [Pirellulales bacterium]
MGFSASRRILATVCWVSLSGSFVAAQESTPAAAPAPAVPAAKSPDKPAVAPAGKPAQVMPELYYLKDKNGNLQAVPGFTFEDFEELYRLKNQLAEGDQKPRYTLENISAAGTASPNHAELVLGFRIVVRDKDWVRVPLRLDAAVLREPPQYQGSGEYFLHFEDNGQGYVVWIRGDPSQPHQLTLKVLAPLAGGGSESRLKLSLPRANASQLKLQVPLARAVATASDGATVLSADPAAGNATEFTVAGLGGDFSLSWREAANVSGSASAVLEATGEILSRVDSRSVGTEARLTVRSLTGPFDRFRVRLPQGAEPVIGNPSEYTLVPVVEKASEGAAARTNLVEVKLKNKTTGPVEIRLLTEQPHDAVKTSELLELAGFEVVGAVRQAGFIAVQVAGDWQVVWGERRRVRQVDELPRSLQREEVAAGFEYFSQPCSLQAKLLPRKTRIGVEPEYLVFVDPNQVRLEARLKYAIRGAKVLALDVELPGWQIDEIGPANQVAVDGIAAGTGSVVSIPLLQQSLGEIEIQLRAHQPLAAAARSLSVSLPRPRVNSLGPAVVAVVPADNVELTPRAEETVGLRRQQGAPPAALPPRQQAALFYRSEAADAKFVADLQVHARSVAVDVSSRIDLTQKQGRVEQTLSYRVAYEPLDRLILEVPRSLADPEKLEVELGGQPLAPVALPDETPGDEARRPARMRVTLPLARIGAWELKVRYPVPEGKPPRGKGLSLSVPLVLPGDGVLASHELIVMPAPGLKVLPDEKAWRTPGDSAPRPAARGELRFVTKDRVAQAVLAVQPDGLAAKNSTLVERVWVQTWLSPTARQDRAVFRFTSSEDHFALTLPAGTIVGRSEVLLDGKSISPAAAVNGRLTIALPADAPSRRHVLELWYHFPGSEGRSRSFAIELPKPGDGVPVRRMYWQLVLPQDEHLIVVPAELTRECAWGWQGLCWGRQPLLEQFQLETWASASRQTDLPDGTNRYLFSVAGSPGIVELWTVSRSLLVLIASGAALVVGLLLIYVPLARGPGALLVVALGLLTAAAVYPEAALLVAQAASFGMVLALMAGVLEGIARRRRGRRTSPADSSSILDRASTEVQFRLPKAGPPGSTETAAAVLATPAPEPKP